METKGYLQDFIKNTGAIDKSDSAVILAGLIEEEIKRMPEPPQVCLMQGTVLLQKVRTHGKSLARFYEELGLLGEEEVE